MVDLAAPLTVSFVPSQSTCLGPIAVSQLPSSADWVA